MLLDQDLHIVRVNRNLCRLFGIRPESLIGTRIDEWVNADPALLLRLSSLIKSAGTSCHVSVRLRLCGLRVLAASVMLRPLYSRRSGYLLISLDEVEGS